MSKMGQTVMEIQELYQSGFSVEQIMKMTKCPRDFVEGALIGLDEWPEPEPDFGT
jgi:hypothetical protein